MLMKAADPFVKRTAVRSAGVASTAPLGSIRQYKQVQPGEQQQKEREQGEEAHPEHQLLLLRENDIDDDIGDDKQGKNHRQPAMGLAKPGIPVHCDLLLYLTAFFTSALICSSTAGVNAVSPKAVGHMAPSSRFAVSLKPRVA